MDIKTLEYFLAVASEESITKAAEFLHMSQPPLSRQMKELELELGKKLFVRGSRKIALTEEGEILKRRSEEIISLIAKTKSEVESSSNDISGNVNIDTSGYACIGKLAKAMLSLSETHPNIRVNLLSKDTDTEFDFYITENAKETRKFNYFCLDSSNIFGVLIPNNSPYANRSKLSIKELSFIPVAVPFDMQGDTALAKLHIIGTYSPPHVAETLAESGITALTKRAKSSKSAKFIPLDSFRKTTYYISWIKNKPLSEQASKYIEELMKEAELP